MTMIPTLTREEAVAWATQLNLEPVISNLRTAERRWPRHVAREISVEYRRFLVLSVLYPDVEVVPGCLLREFDRSARDIADVVAVLPPSGRWAGSQDTPSTSEVVGPLYEQTFCRPVPETWFTEDLDRFLGSSQPGIVG